MARVDLQTIMAASPEKVWALVGDPTRWPEWQHAMVRVVGGGDGKYRVAGRGSRGEYLYEIRVDALELGRRLTWSYTARIKGGGEYILEPEGSGTRMRLRESLQLRMLPGVRWLVERMAFSRQFRKAAEGALEALRERAEAEG